MRRILSILAVLVLAGCGTDDPGPIPEACPAGGCPSPSVASQPASEAPPPSTAAASPTPAAPKLGAGVTRDDQGYTVTVTVHAYRQPTARSAPKPSADGMEWASADVQVCVKTVPSNLPGAMLSWRPWALAYPDGTTAEHSNTIYNQFDGPRYPDSDRVVKAGSCTRGWVTFEAPAGKRASAVEYRGVTNDVLSWSTG